MLTMYQRYLHNLTHKTSEVKKIDLDSTLLFAMYFDWKFK